MAWSVKPLRDAVDHFQLTFNKIYILHGTLYTFAYIKLSQGLLSSEGSSSALFLFIFKEIDFMWWWYFCMFVHPLLLNQSLSSKLTDK